jgi:hypothetical protein
MRLRIWYEWIFTSRLLMYEPCARVEIENMIWMDFYIINVWTLCKGLLRDWVHRQCGKKKGRWKPLSTDLEFCCSLLSSLWLWLAAAAAASRFASKAVTTSLLEGGGGLFSGGAGGCPREVGAATEVMVAVTEPEPVDAGSSFLKNSPRLLCNCETHNTKKKKNINP